MPVCAGLDRSTYTAMRLAEYASVQVQCLIIWESKVQTDLEAVRARLAGFLSGPTG